MPIDELEDITISTPCQRIPCGCKYILWPTFDPEVGDITTDFVRIRLCDRHKDEIALSSPVYKELTRLAEQLMDKISVYTYHNDTIGMQDIMDAYTKLEQHICPEVDKDEDKG